MSAHDIYRNCLLFTSAERRLFSFAGPVNVILNGHFATILQYFFFFFLIFGC